MTTNMRKTLIVAFITVIALLSATYVFSSNNTAKPAADLKVYTVKELSAFDGQDGKPAYVAVDGKIYDVTLIRAWRKGQHKGFKAGRDLTKEISMSPHGKRVMALIPIVGTLKSDK